MEKECLWCREKFEALHAKHVFCDSSCSNRHHKKYGPVNGKKNRKPYYLIHPELTEILMQESFHKIWKSLE